MPINVFATHTHNTQVIGLTSFRNDIYSTLVVDSMKSNLVHASDRCKIKSAPYESV